MSDQVQTKKVEQELDKAVAELSKRLSSELKINPEFYGNVIMEVSFRAGHPVHLKHSIEVAQKL